MSVDADFLTSIYRQTEKLRLDILSEIKDNPDFPADTPEIPGATVELKNGVLHITVTECLPRLCDTKGSARLRNHWLGMIRKALAGINTVFKHALCLIIIHAPNPALWDVDNRAVKFILDAIRYCRLIPDDTWNYISYLVTGKPDMERPRTEIYVIEAGKSYIENILKMAIKCHNMET